MSQVFRNRSVDRRSFIGGSDARIIMGSDETALIQLWREKRGEAQPEDLSSNLIVQLGSATEELNRAWYEAQHGSTGDRLPAPRQTCDHPLHGGHT
jgi:predicted phage-related endonuclease